MHAESRLQRADALVCTVVFAVSTLYCATQPYNLYGLDEGYFLYEAKRILDGQLFYRDFFQLVTPAAWYAMAGSFWLFGTSMATARTTMAVVHGLIAVCMVLACRALGVRRSIAAVVGLAEAAVCYPPVARAAPHWFATLFSMVLLLVLLRRRLTSARYALLAGALVGILFLIQQSKGAGMALAPAVMLLADHWLLARAPRIDWRSALTCAAACAAGVLVVVISILGLFVLFGGFEPVYAALVRFPLGNYRAFHASVRWGGYAPGFDPPIAPVIKYLSLLVPAAAAARVVWQWRAGWSPAARRPLLVALAASAGALLSVNYSPGYPYLALVAPIWLTPLAEMLNAAVERVERSWRWASGVSMALLIAIVVFFAFTLVNLRRAMLAQWGYATETPFGRIAFASEQDLALFLAARAEIDRAATRAVFVYPSLPGFYLLTDTINPTRFQVLIPRYSAPEHEEEVLDVLEAQRVPFIVFNLYPMDHKADRIRPYIRQRYERVQLPFPRGKIPPLALFRRKPDAVASEAGLY
jgi:hypothetical protein